jgi:hypothetical protein
MLTTADIEQQQTTTSIDRLLTIFRAVGVAVPAGAAAGLLAAGIGGRLAMRASGFMFSRDHPGRFAITENGNQVGEITAGGTIFLVIFGTVLGIMGAYFYVGLKPWLPGNLAVRGILFGVLLLLLLSPLSLDPANEDFQQFGSPAVNVMLFILLFLAYGLLIAPIDAWLDRLLPAKFEPTRQDLNIRSIARYTVLLGGVAAGLLFFQGLVMISFIIVLDGENSAEQLRGGALIASVLILLPAYFFLLPSVQERGYQATFQAHRVLSVLIGGGAVIVLVAGLAITATSIYSIVAG